MIALGCDHGGFNLISAIKKHFDEQGINRALLTRISALTVRTALIIPFTPAR